LVVWLVLDYVLAFLLAVSSPVAGVIMFIDDRMPNASPILNDALLQWLVAIMMALLLLYTSCLRAEAAQPDIGLS
jgi:hypothetical protein